MLTKEKTNVAVKKQQIYKFNADQYIPEEDLIAVEAPVEIRLGSGPAHSRTEEDLAMTMRTPGQDVDLAIGYLFTEGLITRYDQIKSGRSIDEQTVLIELDESVQVDMSNQSRHSYTSSSCGVCGKTSVDMIKTEPAFFSKLLSPKADASLLGSLPRKLFESQSVFTRTGGNHAAALFDLEGQLVVSAEDVGRHNALDKLIGKALQLGMIPIQNHILLLSGRISFELVQKAVMAGIGMIAAIGAPSSLAIELGREHGVTLVGFLREHSFNVYCGKVRITGL
jgi:FdhD protein